MAKRRLGRRDEAALPDEASITVESETEDANETSDEKAQRKSDEKILAIARKRFRTVQTAEQAFREEALDDTRFRAGTWKGKSFQWDLKVQQARMDDDQPCLTINRIPGFIRQVTNAARMARLRILVSPVDDFADPDTAEALQGIIRNIENQSFADRAYAMASEKQAEQGRGYIKLATEYAEPDNPKSFRVKIRIKRVKNPLRIYVDPTAEEADYSDARYAFEVADLDREVYKDLSGKKAPEPTSFEGFDDQDTLTGEWFPNGKIRVATYYSKEPKGPKSHVALLSTGDTIKYPTPEQMQRLLQNKIYVEKDRWVQKHVIVVRKITGLTIDETTEWPAKAQPFIPVLGDELEIDGEKDFRGVTRDAKDGGRLYNAMTSALIGAVKGSLQTTVVGWRGQFGAEGTPQRKAWENAHKRRYSFLEVDPVDIDGKPGGGFPSGNHFTQDISGIVEAIHQTDEDLKTTGGFRDASLGERGPQESGRAIKLRQDQDQLGSSHYLDNERFALCAVGRQLIDLIRACMDVAQVVRIVGSDERAKKVMVFVGQDNDPRTADPNFQLPKGVTGVFDLGAGEFDVEVSAGQSNTRRQEAAEAMGQLLPSLPPQIAVNFLDIYFLLLDLPMAKQLADRAKKMLPKELQDPEDGQEPVPAAAQQQIAELTQQLQMAMAAAKQMQQEIQTEQVKMQGQLQSKQMEIASKERLENLKAKLDLVKSHIELKGDEALKLIEGEIEQQTVARQAEFDRQALVLQAGFDRQLEEVKHGNKADEIVLAAKVAPKPAPAAKPAAKKKAS